MAQEEQQLVTKIIPDNIIKSQRIAGFGKRNIADGVIAVIIAFFLIRLVPFVPRVQAIVTICTALALFLVCLFGVKGMSLSECAVNIFISRRTKHNYHMRSIRYVKRKKDGDWAPGKTRVLNESILEKGIRHAKAFISEQKERFQEK